MDHQASCKFLYSASLIVSIFFYDINTIIVTANFDLNIMYLWSKQRYFRLHDALVDT